MIPPTPFYNRRLLILSSGKFEGKSFLYEVHFIEFHCINTIQCLWILQVELFEALVKNIEEDSDF